MSEKYEKERKKQTMSEEKNQSGYIFADENENTNDENESLVRTYSAPFAEGCRNLFGAVDEFDKESAFLNFFEGAKQNDSDCIYYLGMCFEYGFGCEVNLKSAFESYKKAAEMNNVEAINNLGGCYFYGHGTKKNLNQAFLCFKKSAELGSIKAICRVGISYQYGYGTEKDSNKAVEYFKKAALLDSDIACMILADLYDRGDMVDSNIHESFNYYEKAANLGNISAMIELGDRLMSNKVTAKNTKDALYWYTLAAKRGSVEAKFKVAYCNYEGIGKVTNYREAYRLYSELANQDLHKEIALYKLGICYLKGNGINMNRKKAFECFNESAKMHLVEAYFALGECYTFGIGTDINYENAFECYTKASCDRCSAAYIALGECYEHGLGVTPDDISALKMYKKAADLDNIEGVYNLGRCINQGIGKDAGFRNSRMFILRAAKKKHVASSLMLAKELEESGDIETAIMWYKNCVSFDFKSSSAEYISNDRKNILLNRDVNSKTEAKYHLGILKLSLNRLPRNCVESLNYIADAAAHGFDAAILQITKIYNHYGEFKINQAFELNELQGLIQDENIAAAIFKLGNAYFNGSYGGIMKNISLAARSYKISADMGNVDAMYCYGWCLRHGKGVKESNKDAAIWLKKAADLGNSNAMYSYGLCCEEGSATGIKNRREALSYYRKAALLGHVDAGKRYSMLLRNEKTNDVIGKK